MHPHSSLPWPVVTCRGLAPCRSPVSPASSQSHSHQEASASSLQSCQPFAKALAVNPQTPQLGWKGGAEVHQTWLPALTGMTWQPGQARRNPGSHVMPSPPKTVNVWPIFAPQDTLQDEHLLALPCLGAFPYNHLPQASSQGKLNIKRDSCCRYLLTSLTCRRRPTSR